MAQERKFRIAAVTGTRADYGLLRWTLSEIEDNPDLQLITVVAAMHLAPEFGMTVQAIEGDGFKIDERVPCLMAGDDLESLGGSMGIALSGFTSAFARQKPDMVIILGDRFEALAAASAATALKIPIAHIHGGEVTEGAMDEAFRHAITKMSHLHFTAAETYSRRVIQMGEAPWRVEMVGAVGLDNFIRTKRITLEALSTNLGFDLSTPYVLMTYHPATLGEDSMGELEALLNVVGSSGLKILATKANADPGGRAINRRLEEAAAISPERMHLVTSLGHSLYLTALEKATLVAGNSSSGIIEAPAVNVPVVNVGTRQAGRLRAVGIVDCSLPEENIADGFSRALSNELHESMRTAEPPYGRPGDAARAIVARISQTLQATPSARQKLLVKSFHDLPWHGAD